MKYYMVYILYNGGTVQLFMTIMEPNDTVLYYLKFFTYYEKKTN